jgi:hypothetical protein
VKKKEYDSRIGLSYYCQQQIGQTTNKSCSKLPDESTKAAKYKKHDGVQIESDYTEQDHKVIVNGRNGQA